MTTIPDVNIMRETAESITNEHRDNFARSEVFKKMCSDIQTTALKGDFAAWFNESKSVSQKDLHSAKELFKQNGYLTQLAFKTLIVSWGKNHDENEQN